MPDQSPDAMRRVRISVPESDQVTLDWMSEQYNISVAVRQLVRQHVSQHGTGDIFSLPMQKSPASAPTQEQEAPQPAGEKPQERQPSRATEQPESPPEDDSYDMDALMNG